MELTLPIWLQLILRASILVSGITIVKALELPWKTRKDWVLVMKAAFQGTQLQEMKVSWIHQAPYPWISSRMMSCLKRLLLQERPRSFKSAIQCQIYLDLNSWESQGRRLPSRMWRRRHHPTRRRSRASTTPCMTNSLLLVKALTIRIRPCQVISRWIWLAICRIHQGRLWMESQLLISLLSSQSQRIRQRRASSQRVLIRSTSSLKSTKYLGEMNTVKRWLTSWSHLMITQYTQASNHHKSFRLSYQKPPQGSIRMLIEGADLFDLVERPLKCLGICQYLLFRSKT